MTPPPSNPTPPDSPDAVPRNDREVYRAVYPASYPVSLIPHVLLDEEPAAAPLLDCSEQGIRYRAMSGESPPLGTPVHGELRTHDGKIRALSGHVVRAEPGEVAIRLYPPGLPFSLLLAEQRAVLIWDRTRAESAESADAARSAKPTD